MQAVFNFIMPIFTKVIIMFLLSGSIHLSGGAPYSRSRWRSFTNGNGTDSSSSRLYTGNRTLRLIIYLLFSTVIILFIFISVSTYHKYKCVEITECKLYMRVDNTNITSRIIQCLWHESLNDRESYGVVTNMNMLSLETMGWCWSLSGTRSF
jgi:hypothetical protein